jgi:hypothetical protein
VSTKSFKALLDRAPDRDSSIIAGFHFVFIGGVGAGREQLIAAGQRTPAGSQLRRGETARIRSPSFSIVSQASVAAGRMPALPYRPQ